MSRCQDVMDCDESPWEGMGGPKSLGLGGRCQDVMDCDENPWEGMGKPESLGFGALEEDTRCAEL